MYHVTSILSYHDIYREWLNDKLVLSANQYDGKFSAFMPFSYRNYPGVISLNFDYRNLLFNDHEKDDDTDASITNWPQYGLSGTIGWQLNQHRIVCLG